nr:TPA: Cygno [Baja California bark scorpion polyomavirus 1]
MFLIDPNKAEIPLRSISIGCRCVHCLNAPEAVIHAPPDTIIGILKGFLETFLNLEVLKHMTHNLCATWRYNYYLKNNPEKADIRWLFKQKVSNGRGRFDRWGCSFIFNRGIC